MKIISVFGSSVPASHEADYVDAQNIGRALGEAGYTVMTGGYMGVMEAASRGAAEAGAHVIGVTCKQILSIRPGAKANPWVKEEILCDTLNERLHHLITQADGCVVMPGGVGTLNEMVLAWELMRVNAIRQVPIICYGDFWAKVIQPFVASSYYVPSHHQDMIQFVDTPKRAVELLQKG